MKLLDATFPVQTMIVATGNGPLGKGVHGAIPLHLQFETRTVTVGPGRPLKFKVTMSVS